METADSSAIKNLPVMQEMWVQSLGWEDSPEKEMAIHSSILAWEISWTEKPDGLQSMGLQQSDMTYQLNHHHHKTIHTCFQIYQFYCFLILYLFFSFFCLLCVFFSFVFIFFWFLKFKVLIICIFLSKYKPLIL